MPAGQLKKRKVNTQTVTNPRYNSPVNKTHYIPLPSADDRNGERAHDQALSPTPPVQPQKKVQKSAKKRIFESSKDEAKDNNQTMSPPVQPRKKVQPGSKKKHHRSPAVEEGSKDKNITKEPTCQSKKTRDSHKNDASDQSDDSDIQVIENPGPKESPEKELGMPNQ